MSTHKFMLAGFGGQGVILMGQMLAYAGMFEGKEVTFMPSYGPEMRGGTANCTVIISDEPIACPIADSVDTLLAMNYPSLEKFETLVEPGGKIFLNTSLYDNEPDRKDVVLYKVDTLALANDLGNLKAANMVMLGAIVRKTEAVEMETVVRVMEQKVFSGAKAKLLPLNEKALKAWTE